LVQVLPATEPVQVRVVPPVTPVMVLAPFSESTPVKGVVPPQSAANEQPFWVTVTGEPCNAVWQWDWMVHWPATFGHCPPLPLLPQAGRSAAVRARSKRVFHTGLPSLFCGFGVWRRLWRRGRESHWHRRSAGLPASSGIARAGCPLLSSGRRLIQLSLRREVGPRLLRRLV
jgi:hypothetical protein